LPATWQRHRFPGWRPERPTASAFPLLDLVTTGYGAFAAFRWYRFPLSNPGAASASGSTVNSSAVAPRPPGFPACAEPVWQKNVPKNNNEQCITIAQTLIGQTAQITEFLQKKRITIVKILLTVIVKSNIVIDNQCRAGYEMKLPIDVSLSES
jgi:hypothetical protein